MANNSSDGDGIVWVILFGLAAWFAYDKWWKEPDLPKPPPPALSVPLTGMLYVTTSKSGTSIRVDADSVRGDRQHRRGWVVSDHSRDKEAPQRETKELYIANCDEGSFRVPSFVTYDKKGDVLSSWDETDTDKAKTQHATPGTIGETTFDKLCDSRFDPLPIPPPVAIK